jgi:hypothetical protein
MHLATCNGTTKSSLVAMRIAPCSAVPTDELGETWFVFRRAQPYSDCLFFRGHGDANQTYGPERLTLFAVSSSL